MARFEDHIEKLIQEKEGGYRLIDVHNDRGGMTYAGIARNANPNWPGWKYVDEGKSPPKNMVHALYKVQYWDSVSAGSCKDGRVAEILFSCSVLRGPGRALKMAQAAMGISADGITGPNTRKALSSAVYSTFAPRFAIARIAAFAEIADRDKTQRKFFRGWVNRVLRETDLSA